MSGATVRVRDGVVYLVQECTRFLEPVLDRLWWRTGIDPNAVSGGETAVLHDDGSYSVGRYRGWLANGGKERPAFAEQEPVPAPRVRAGAEVRWNSGHWQRLTRRGWVPAEYARGARS